MEDYKAKIPDGSEIILNGKTIVTSYDIPIMLSKEQIDIILKLKMNISSLGDNYAVELSNNIGTVVVRVRDVLLYGKEGDIK